jgi:hypothetical protein
MKTRKTKKIEFKKYLETLPDWQLKSAVIDYELMDNPSEQETIMFNEVIEEIGRRILENNH